MESSVLCFVMDRLFNLLGALLREVCKPPFAQWTKCKCLKRKKKKIYFDNMSKELKKKKKYKAHRRKIDLKMWSLLWLLLVSLDCDECNQPKQLHCSTSVYFRQLAQGFKMLSKSIAESINLTHNYTRRPGFQETLQWRISWNTFPRQ